MVAFYGRPIGVGTLECHQDQNGASSAMKKPRKPWSHEALGGCMALETKIAPRGPVMELRDLKMLYSLKFEILEI